MNKEIHNRSEVSTRSPELYHRIERSEDHEISEKGPITEIHTRNETLEGDIHPVTGVPFNRNKIDLPSGERVEGVFPKFDSKFDAQLPEKQYLDTDKNQFKECNRQLYEKIQNDPEFAKQFTDIQKDQINDGIKEGTAPDGYVWHHNEEPGKMQLVNAEIHAGTGHTGGKVLWGGGGDFR